MKANLETLLVLHGLPRPAREVRFHPVRKWRFDFAYPAPILLAIEQDGGGWVHGRHHRHRGHEEDARKRNEAILMGWRVLTFTPEMIASGEAIATIRRALENR